MPTHKKGQDRDKYYQLAKDQGYRSRAAFKLIQINKRYDFLRKSKVCIDLCAAPGGWCQVAAKYMPAGSLVLGIDLLPIKPLRGVKTIVGDITTSATRKMIVSELQGWKADVVLCDGAPNIGSAYTKDAFVQNELVLAALKTATEHLNKGGTFVTKVYRSVDYNSLVWVLQQFFQDIQTMKPNSSRSQSSEIFLVCLSYNAPSSIDSKLFDPNHVFKEFQDPGLKGPDVLHKKYDTSYKRQRSGYDDSLGITLHSKIPVSEFINSKEPVRLLTDIHEMIFGNDCQKYLEHPKTTEEIKLALSDLKVLGKIDFKKLLKWRQCMIDSFHTDTEEKSEEDSDNEEPEEEPIDPEQQILEEIDQLYMAAEKEKHKNLKKDRKLKRKERLRQALGMHHNAFSVDEDTELFSLNRKLTRNDIDEMNDVPLDADDNAYVQALAEEEGLLPTEEVEEGDPAATSSRRKRLQKESVFLPQEALEEELEDDYIAFTSKKRLKNSLKERELQQKIEDQELESRTITMKKAAKAQTPLAQLQKLQENDEMILAEHEVSESEDREHENNHNSGKNRKEKVAALQEDLENYLKLLSGKQEKSQKKNSKRSQQDDSDSSSDDSDDEDNDQEGEGSNRLISRDMPSLSSRTGKWFANPIFGSDQSKVVSFEEEENSNDESEGDDKESDGRFDFMPKTDREKRKEKRKKDQLRQEKRNLKRSRDVMSLDDDDDDIDTMGNGKTDKGIKIVASHHHLPLELLQTVQETTEQIKRKKAKTSHTGNGQSEKNAEEKESDSFQVVSQEQSQKVIEEALPRVDERSYDSDHEEYDAHDRVMTMALGTYMLRNSRKKALIDASYNRYSWNDPEGLPTWFLDDEIRHNKPQLPVPHALVEQLKNKYQLTGTKVIKKEAEARARKKKRAMLKLKAAKKQATMMAENSELSEKQKLKAIAKAVRNTKDVKTSKIYVTTKKTKAGSVGTMKNAGSKGNLKFVDSRMKKDKRAMKAREKRKGKR